MISPQWIRRAVLAALPALLAPPARAAAPTAEGDWDGALAVGGSKLRVALHLKPIPGGYAASFDSPDQGAMGLPAAGVEGGDDALVVRFAFGQFKGALAPDGQTLAGTWTQGGSTLPLSFVRRAPGGPVATLDRPQIPAKPYPYRELEVALDNPAAPGVKLAGTLTLPQGAGPFPAVVLIAGSGPSLRNEEVFGHPIFLVLADHLTRAGIAVLRYDKRGIGGSTGDLAKAGLNEFASDAEAAFAWLKARPEIRAGKVGLIGHSEGGCVAPMIAALRRDVAFLVLLAAPAAQGIELLERQNMALARAAGASEPQVDDMIALKHRLFVAAATAASADDAVSKIHALLVAARPEAPAATLDAEARAYASPALRSLLAYDPKPALQAVRCPVLALNGSKDLQVVAAQNLPLLREDLASNPDATVRELPGLNHLFQTAQTGSPAEYGRIE
ncbi:alpha/beta hydrolase family protein [Phenylobacterium aquaticum]|uniref:alpha/beta hydrolase family protein n=1 Tax=Phenylobacterium aquaticum TaxID=1763816 RepID=UPI001F5D8BA7|nr:alpha/beta hydrolase [Phenylobacterium aquaticum]MCI3135494.1 alpha/beta hydrolase [Phenylobacterium aquaticum]